MYEIFLCLKGVTVRRGDERFIAQILKIHFPRLGFSSFPPATQLHHTSPHRQHLVPCNNTNNNNVSRQLQNIIATFPTCKRRVYWIGYTMCGCNSFLRLSYSFGRMKVALFFRSYFPWMPSSTLSMLSLRLGRFDSHFLQPSSLALSLFPPAACKYFLCSFPFPLIFHSVRSHSPRNMRKCLSLEILRLLICFCVRNGNSARRK